MMRRTTKFIGDIGEDYAVRYLKKQKYKIIARNYRNRCGEIDIIARKGDIIAFTEVKTRHLNPVTEPYEAVDHRKRMKIIRTASIFIAETGADAFFRFDVCEVFLNENTLEVEKLEYYENAFTADRY